MEEIYIRLLKVLYDEKELYTELVSLSQQMKQAILDQDVPALDAIVRQEQGAVLRLSQWEQLRLRCVEDFAAQWQQPPDAVRMRLIIDKAPAEAVTELETLYAELSALIETLHELNTHNSAMVKARLDYANYAVNFFTTDPLAGHAYSARGYESAPDRTPGKSMIDRKV